MGLQEDEADHFPRNALGQKIMNGEEVAKRLGHLLALDLQHLVMKPVARELALGMRAAALGDFVFMMWEHQVVAATMNVEARPQQFVAHGRTLDMPARTPTPPGAVPARKIVGGRLPQDEIHRVALVRGHFHAGPCNHVIHRAARELPVFGVALDREEHVTIGGIGMPLGDQPFDHRDHLADILCRARHLVGLHHAKRGHVVEIPLGRFGRDLADRPPGFGGLGVDLVIHVGEVAHIGDMFGPVDVTEQPVGHVKDHRRARIAHMGAVIDRGATDIHAHIAGIQRLEDLLLPGAGVVKLDRGHGLVLTRGARGRAYQLLLRFGSNERTALTMSADNAADNADGCVHGRDPRPLPPPCQAPPANCRGGR